MDWDQKAQARLELVPFFIRKKVRQQIEEYVTKRGGQRVREQDVVEARRSLMGGGNSPDIDKPAGDSGILVADPSRFARLEEIVEKGAALEGMRTRYHEIRVCGGAAGCPLSVIEDRQVARNLAAIIDETGLDQCLSSRFKGLVLVHHRFRLALAGCSNCCSQPQIVDLGIIGQSCPECAEDLCTGCGLCVEACDEGAIEMQEGRPVFDPSLCLNCGDCIRGCPVNAITEARKGYKILIGGKLGRHPRLAITWKDMATEEGVYSALRQAIRLYMEQGLEEERFSGMLERTGWMGLGHSSSGL